MATKTNLPWIEKYRPKDMSEISAQEEIVQVLRKSITSKNLPHLLFYGPPGTGKTSSILALARELYGEKELKEKVLELNASDERGIAVVREKVKNFAKRSVSTGVNANGHSISYKIIILDEADSLTSDAQAALRRIMEEHSKVTRFCLICNYVSRIIEPLASRCAKFRFKPIPQELGLKRLQFICESEGLNYDNEALEKLITTCNGDLRRAIMLLQSSQKYYEEKLTCKQVDEIAGVIPDNVIETLLNTTMTKGSGDMIEACKTIIADGYPLDSILQQIRKFILKSVHLTTLQKANIGICLGKVDVACALGGDDYLNLLELLFTIANNK
ncbi:P-loop containing nucleoside triphosphate hydrolase protein [Neoconidiobolus thromboides FSU 785]|nr:P-loop containing nucleoside triphosphate hydrolase protein [Neoconidiobolus thromboides FSU 785]